MTAGVSEAAPAWRRFGEAPGPILRTPDGTIRTGSTAKREVQLVQGEGLVTIGIDPIAEGESSGALLYTWAGAGVSAKRAVIRPVARPTRNDSTG